MMVKTTAGTWPGLDQSSVLKERAARNKKAVQSMRSISAVKKLSTPSRRQAVKR